jgi:indoleamine 2,3-dioxygenase
MLERGFLPDEDPLTEFPPGSRFADLDGLGRDLPSLLHDKGFRAQVRKLNLAALPSEPIPLPELHLYYVRLGFLASAYVNQVGQEPATGSLHQA